MNTQAQELATRARKLAGRARRRVHGASKANPSRDQPSLIPSVPLEGTRVLFLHHSTGHRIWRAGLPEWFERYNRAHNLDYNLVARAYPHWPYTWTNDPYDYWRLWVAHRGADTYRRQETLDQLASAYDVIVWKHCFTAAQIAPDAGPGRAGARDKTLANFTATYEALAAEMRRFPETTFIVWTTPPRAEGDTTAEQAQRATQFARWVREEWDEPGDNIHIFDYHALAAPGGHLRSDYAVSATDSHPSDAFAAQAVPVLGQRITDIVEGRAD